MPVYEKVGVARTYTQPTHCLLVNDFLSVPSIVQAEQIFTVDKSRVLKFLGHLTPEEMSRVDDAVRASLALNPMGNIQRLPPIIHSTAAYAPPEVVDGKPPIYPLHPSNRPLRRTLKGMMRQPAEKPGGKHSFLKTV